MSHRHIDLCFFDNRCHNCLHRCHNSISVDYGPCASDISSRQRIANPCTPVRFRYSPPNLSVIGFSSAHNSNGRRTMTTNNTTNHTLLSFLSSNGHRVWHGKHLFESTNKIMRFCDYADFGTRSIDSFVPEDIYMFSDHLLETGISKNTVNRYFSAISSLLKYAHDMRVIEQYHIPRIKWFKEKSGRPRFMSKTELQELEDFFREHQNS